MLSLSSLAIISQLCGVVVDSKMQPVDSAVVRFQADNRFVKTDSDGFFCIEKGRKDRLTAWADGHYIGGVEVQASENENNLTIVLKKLPKAVDSYDWLKSTELEGKPNDVLVEPCSSCHSRLTTEWKSSAHGTSNKNETFLKLVEAFPNKSNSEKCNQCHLPQNTDTAIGCDFCHKVSAVSSDNSLKLGREKMTFHFPEKGHLFFGSLDDVFLRDDSFNPIYKKSEYCATCHQGRFWRTEVYSEYLEWQETEYPLAGIECQDCHMATNAKLAADTEDGGVIRSSNTLSDHSFTITPEFIESAIEMRVKSSRKKELISLTVSLTNIGAGHRIPTGSPLRHLILIIEPFGMKGKLTQIKGNKVPRWVGDSLVGLPGQAFAKVLVNTPGYGKNTAKKSVYPAAFWNPSHIESDNRLKHKQQHLELFEFKRQGIVRIKIKLLYRKHFANWQLLPPPTDMLIKEMEITL